MPRIRFENRSETSFYVQVDPWAGLYLLHQGESIEIEAQSEADCLSIEIEECRETKILTLPDCEDDFIVKDGQRMHWADFVTNIT